MKIKKTILLSLILLTMTPFNLMAKESSTFEQKVTNTNITEEEIKLAQQAWGQALIQISKDYKSGGLQKATRTAEAVLNKAYGYNMGAVLFKPTLTSGDQVFRTTLEGALSYFVGGNKKYPTDTGFALKNWEKYDFKNAAVFINGDVALTMGNVMITDTSGKVTKIDKTWGFKRDNAGQLRIILHHSSLQYVP